MILSEKSQNKGAWLLIETILMLMYSFNERLNFR